MGAGKSQSAINYINSAENNMKFLYITPFLDEVKRVKESCESKRFKEPEIYGTKLNGIKHLISRGENVVSTHALFRRFDRELIDMCRSQNYTLVMDEVTDVIEPYNISKPDLDILFEKYVYVEDGTNLIKWRENASDYNGKFSEEKRLCDFNCLAYYGDSIMMWLFPIEVFNAFRNIYILTYMFNAQMQRYYYDFYGLPYKYIYVTGNSVSEYHFTDTKPEYKSKYNYKDLIHICENEKLNMIGDSNYDLSMSWYARNANNVAIKKLKNNIYNYFNNIRETKSGQNLWTTFSDYECKLKGKGYGKAFLPHNARATNKYRDRISVAYPINKFLHAVTKNFFVSNGIDVDEDGFATSEMLQFIWRSAIRDGKEIWIYIPSIRMRTLLMNWIDENSL